MGTTSLDKESKTRGSDHGTMIAGPSTIWQALHWGTPLCSPQPVKSARMYSTLVQEDEEQIPDEDLVPLQGVHYRPKDRWYVKVRKNYGQQPRKYHVKTGFHTQMDAYEYRERYLAEMSDLSMNANHDENLNEN